MTITALIIHFILYSINKLELKIVNEYYHKNLNWQQAEQLVIFMYKAQPRSLIQSG